MSIFLGIVTSKGSNIRIIGQDIFMKPYNYVGVAHLYTCKLSGVFSSTRSSQSRLSEQAILMMEMEMDCSQMIDVKKRDVSVVRKMMKDYWEDWAAYQTESGTTMELMVGEKHYNVAMQFYDLDRMDVLNALPKLAGMDVLELGGGSG